MKRTLDYFRSLWTPGYKVKASDMDDLMDSIVHVDDAGSGSSTSIVNGTGSVSVNADGKVTITTPVTQKTDVNSTFNFPNSELVNDLEWPSESAPTFMPSFGFAKGEFNNTAYVNQPDYKNHVLRWGFNNGNVSGKHYVHFAIEQWYRPASSKTWTEAHLEFKATDNTVYRPFTMEADIDYANADTAKKIYFAFQTTEWRINNPRNGGSVWFTDMFYTNTNILLNVNNTGLFGKTTTGSQIKMVSMNSSNFVQLGPTADFFVVSSGVNEGQACFQKEPAQLTWGLGFRLRSPNGTLYAIRVTDAGAINVVAP